VLTSLSFTDASPYVDGVSVDPELSSALSLVTSSNFLVVPLEMNVTGKYGDIMNMVDAIQKGERVVLIRDIGMDGGEVNNSTEVTMVISGDTYVLLDAASVPVVVTPDDGATTTDAGVVAE
jgi:Tfp pilus assembly protein PilO